ncbi:hypothetical protein G6554_19995 [Bacillus sp. MM2020_4]|nr:hypothetical protein [Bacillus sp. MM2020_4]
MVPVFLWKLVAIWGGFVLFAKVSRLFARPMDLFAKPGSLFANLPHLFANLNFTKE